MNDGEKGLIEKAKSDTCPQLTKHKNTHTHSLKKILKLCKIYILCNCRRKKYDISL